MAREPTKPPGLNVIDPDVLDGMKDFLAVYEEHFEEVATRVIDVVIELSSGVAKARDLTREQFEEQTRVSHRLVRRAILDGQWGPLLERRNLQGQTYAHLGIGFPAWFEVVEKFQQILTPHLVTAFATDPRRLAASLAGMNRFLHIGMRETAKAYFSLVEGRLLN